MSIPTIHLIEKANQEANKHIGMALIKLGERKQEANNVSGSKARSSDRRPG